MILTGPCRYCGKTYSFLCSKCCVESEVDEPVCIHCCTNEKDHGPKPFSSEKWLKEVVERLGSDEALVD